ncbi:MAG: phosphoserine phosphatase SerB [Burkholderiales bacterium]
MNRARADAVDAAADLVVIARALPPVVLDRLAALARASAVEPLPRAAGATVRAWRLAGGRGSAALDEACAAASADCASVPRDRRRADVGVLAMDMDSTLITIECIDEIADCAGVKTEVAAITRSAMRGEIDFRESLERRVRLLAGLRVEALEEVYRERVRPSDGAAALLAAFRSAGARTLLVSGGFTYFTSRLRAELGFDEAVANELEIAGGRLTGRLAGPIVDADGKAAALRAARARSRPGLAVAIGDGANDLPMLVAADVSIAYRAKPLVRERATHAIDHGGLDAVIALFR